MKIGRFKMDQWDALSELMDAYKRDIEELPLSPASLERLKMAIEQERIVFYIAQDGLAPIGMCSVSTCFSTYRCETSGRFEDFYVCPSHRRKGVAREMARYVFSDMREREVTTLWVGCINADIKMYESLGFTSRLGNLLSWEMA